MDHTTMENLSSYALQTILIFSCEISLTMLLLRAIVYCNGKEDVHVFDDLAIEIQDLILVIK